MLAVQLTARVASILIFLNALQETSNCLPILNQQHGEESDPAIDTAVKQVKLGVWVLETILLDTLPNQGSAFAESIESLCLLVSTVRELRIEDEEQMALHAVVEAIKFNTCQLISAVNGALDCESFDSLCSKIKLSLQVDRSFRKLAKYRSTEYPQDFNVTQGLQDWVTQNVQADTTTNTWIEEKITSLEPLF